MFTGGMWLWTYAFTYHLVPPEGMLLNKVERSAGMCVSPTAVKASSGILLPVPTESNVLCLLKAVFWLIFESILYVPIFSIIYNCILLMGCCLESYFGNVFAKCLFVCLGKTLKSGGLTVRKSQVLAHICWWLPVWISAGHFSSLPLQSRDGFRCLRDDFMKVWKVFPGSTLNCNYLLLFSFSF